MRGNLDDRVGTCSCVSRHWTAQQRLQSRATTRICRISYCVGDDLQKVDPGSCRFEFANEGLFLHQTGYLGVAVIQQFLQVVAAPSVLIKKAGEVNHSHF